MPTGAAPWSAVFRLSKYHMPAVLHDRYHKDRDIYPWMGVSAFLIVPLH